MGGVIPQSNQQEADPISSYITSVIMSQPLVLYWPMNKCYGCHQNQEAKLKIVGGVIPQSNQQKADPISSYITSVIMS